MIASSINEHSAKVSQKNEAAGRIALSNESVLAGTTIRAEIQSEGDGIKAKNVLDLILLSFEVDKLIMAVVVCFHLRHSKVSAANTH